MKQNILIICFINLLLTSCNGQDKKSDISTTPLPDWQTNTFDYVKQIIPKEIEYSGNNYELTTVNLKKVYITEVDSDTVVLAICSLKAVDKGKSALTYYFISPKTNKRISDFQSIMTIKGCDYSIPAFVIKDINNDGKDDFIYLELYNDKCNGDLWIKSNFHQIKPKTTKNELEYYAKLGNDMRINRKIKRTDINLLQNKLELVVSELFKED